MGGAIDLVQPVRVGFGCLCPIENTHSFVRLAISRYKIGRRALSHRTFHSGILMSMMTDEELLVDLRSRRGYETATGPEVVGGRKYFRINGLPVAIEEVRRIVGDVED